MAVRRIAAGRGGETELVEKDTVDPQVDGKIDVAFENLQPGTAGRTGDPKVLLPYALRNVPVLLKL